jgi:RNA recognition motif-containing protein
VSKKIYVGNLSYKVTEDDLKDLFAEFGALTSVNVITDRETGRPRGFAFVEMDSDDEATKAINSLNGKELQDREIVVNEAKPRRDSGPRGNSGPRRDRRPRY